MINKNVFLEKEIPYKKLEKLGIDKKDVLSMPKEIIEPFLSGKATPLIRAEIKAANGQIVQLPLKLQMTRGKDGEIHLMTYPVRNEIVNDIKLNSHEIERLKQGEVIKKDVEENGSKRQKFVQLDKETNSLMKKNVSSVRMQDKLREFEKINDIELGTNQKRAAMEGKPIELNVGNQKVSVGVDLKEPQGFKVVQGDMKEWQKQKNIEFDLLHEGFMGYVKTDKNRWEYQKVVDRLSPKEDLGISRKQDERKSSALKL